jgi:uncharacterized Tic20 family protein
VERRFQLVKENQMSEVQQEDRTMALIAHLSGILTGFIGPLVIWLINKDKADKGWLVGQAKEALNFQITVIIAMIAAIIIMVVSFGLLFFLPMLVGLGALVLCILAAMKANEGVDYRYPFAIRLIK